MTAAADACGAWEDGGDSGPVSDTAWEADEATREALEAIAGIDPALSVDTYPETVSAASLWQPGYWYWPGPMKGARAKIWKWQQSCSCSPLKPELTLYGRISERLATRLCVPGTN